MVVDLVAFIVVMLAVSFVLLVSWSLLLSSMVLLNVLLCG